MASREEKVDAWMPLFIGDFLRDTSDLTLEEVGAYCRLLMYLWPQRGYLPFDERRLARQIGARAARWAKIWPVLARFFEVTDGKLSQKRLLHERAQAEQRRKNLSERGRRGAQAKHETDAQQRATASAQAEIRQTSSTAQALPNVWPSPSPSPSPSPVEKQIPPKPPRRRGSVCPESSDFQAWYEAFPRKRARNSAWKAWQETEADHPPLAAMLETLEWQKRLEFDRRPPDRVPYPATYLRAGQWKDEKPRTATPSAPSSTPRINGQHVCPFHREIPDKASAERDPLCSVCNRLGERRPRSGTSEPVAIGDDP